MRKILFFLTAIFFVYGFYFINQSHQTVPQKSTLGVQHNLVLFRQPEDGVSPIINVLNSATKQIDVEVYLLSDKDIINSLIDACNRGVVVRVMLEQHPFGGGNINPKTKQQLDNSCVKTEWANAAFTLTHEKTIVIDHAVVFILSQNLTESAFTKNREYDIEDQNAADVSEVENIFTADWNRSTFQQLDKNLVISPLSSRSILESLIKNATKSLDIEMEVVNDPQIISLLTSQAKAVSIHLVVPSLSQMSANKKTLEKLQQAGVLVKLLSSPYPHAKLMVADTQKAYIGSINLTTQSMDENREVGILLSQQDIVNNVEEDFSQDWDKASPFQ